MKAKYTGETSFFELTHGKVYEVLSVEKGRYRVVDKSGGDYLYPPEGFEAVGPGDKTAPTPRALPMRPVRASA